MRRCVERDEQQRGHDHAAKRCRDRQRSLPHGCELADQYLALDLQSHEKEEDGHQAIVHDFVKRQARVRRGDADGDLRLPECMVAVRPWRVRPDERNCRAHEQNQTARWRSLHHAAQWSRYMVDERPFHDYSLAPSVRSGRAPMHPCVSL